LNRDSLEVVGVRLVGAESVAAGCRGVDGSHHSSDTMCGRDELLAVEPDRDGVVGDSQRPCREGGGRGGGYEDPTRIEASGYGGTRISEG